MERRLPSTLIASWLAVGVTGFFALRRALVGHEAGLAWVLGVEAVLVWAVVWIAVLVPRIVTLTAARIGVPLALAAGVWMFVVGGSVAWTTAFTVTAVLALAALSLPATIDAFVDGSSYGPEQRFALRTPLLTALVATPVTWVVAVAIAVVPPLAVSGWLVPALVLGVAWVFVFRWAVRSLHLPARRWVVFVPAGMVLSDPLVLTDRVLFPRREVEAIGPAYADTDAPDLVPGTLGLALQLDLTEPFALPMIDRAGTPGHEPTGGRTGDTPGERTLATDRFVFSVLRPGALLVTAGERRFDVGATLATEPFCEHHQHVHDDVPGHPHDDPPVVEESQTAVPLPRTRSSR